MEGLDPNQLSDRELLLHIYEEQRRQGLRVDSHGKRLTALETWRTAIVGGSVVVAALFKPIVEWIQKPHG